MRYDSISAEQRHIEAIAAEMLAAARTAPKAHGLDKLECFALDGEEKDALAEKMREYVASGGPAFFERDANNIDQAQMVLLFGAVNEPYGLNCGYCGEETCKEAMEKGRKCFFAAHDLGLAIGSAVSKATDGRVDCRVLYSAGTVAKEIKLFRSDVFAAIAIPLSVSKKNPFFDRKWPK